jgi:hypothetical protein
MSVHRIQHRQIVTIAKRPSQLGTGWRELLKMICPTGRAKYFYTEEWTVESALMSREKVDFWRNEKPGVRPGSSPFGQCSVVSALRGRGRRHRPVRREEPR